MQTVKTYFKALNSPENKPLAMVFCASILLFILRIVYVYLGPIDLAPDEAHYWEWSRYLDWSYYSKPPMVAWLNYVSTSILGNTHVGVRFFSVLILSVLTVFAFLIGKQVTGKNSAGYVATVLLNITPEFAAGGLLMTPDVPTLLFWTVALYILLNVDFEHTPAKKHLKTFVLLGFIVGLAGLSKYTAALFYPILGLYLLVDKNRRQWLFSPYVYIAGVISLLMQAPVFYWNAVNDWVTFKHVMGQSGGSSSFNGVESIGNFLGGQLGIVGVVIFPMLLWVWLRLPKTTYSVSQVNSRMKLLWWFSAPVFVFFLIKSLGAKVQPNWPVLSIYVGLLLLACWVVFESSLRKKVFAFGAVLSLCVTIIAHDTNIIRMVGVDLPHKSDPLKPALGWRGLGVSLSTILNNIAGEKVILTTRYQTASPLSFYIEGNPKVVYFNTGGRRQNQYDLWDWPDLEGKAVIYIKERDKVLDPQIKNAFRSCIYLGAVASNRGSIILRSAHVYACGGYLGLKRNYADKY